MSEGEILKQEHGAMLRVGQSSQVILGGKPWFKNERPR